MLDTIHTSAHRKLPLWHNPAIICSNGQDSKSIRKPGSTRYTPPRTDNFPSGTAGILSHSPLSTLNAHRSLSLPSGPHPPNTYTLPSSAADAW